jgi:thiol-disulfide isomerase/thioredoxin
LIVRIAYVLGLLGTVVGLTAGCAGGSGDAGTASSAPAPPTASATSSAVAAPTQLDFVAPTVGGQEFSGATLAGKPVVFWFWTPWCPACQGEAPEVAKLAKANPDITFVGVSARDQVPAMQEFIDKYDTGSFTNIADVDGAVWQRFGVTAQPAFAFVGRDGSVDVVRGPLPESELAAQVADLKS